MKKSIIIATVALCFLAVGIVAQNQTGGQGSNSQSSSPLAEFTSQELAGMPYLVEIKINDFANNTNYKKFVNMQNGEILDNIDYSEYSALDISGNSQFRVNGLAKSGLYSDTYQTYRNNDFKIESKEGLLGYKRIYSTGLIEEKAFNPQNSNFNFAELFDPTGNILIYQGQDNYGGLDGTICPRMLDGDTYNALYSYNLNTQEEKIVFNVKKKCVNIDIEKYLIPRSFFIKNPKFKKLSSAFSLQTRGILSGPGGGCIHPGQIGWENGTHKYKLVLPFETKAFVDRENQDNKYCVDKCGIPIGVCPDNGLHDGGSPHGFPAVDFTMTKSSDGKIWVCAAADGIVVHAGWNKFDHSASYGYCVYIDHSPDETDKTKKVYAIYGHGTEGTLQIPIQDRPTPKNLRTKVKKGQRLFVMGTTGASTGPHVHFEISNYGEGSYGLPSASRGGSCELFYNGDDFNTFVPIFEEYERCSARNKYTYTSGKMSKDDCSGNSDPGNGGNTSSCFSDLGEPNEAISEAHPLYSTAFSGLFSQTYNACMEATKSGDPLSSDRYKIYLNPLGAGGRLYVTIKNIQFAGAMYNHMA